MNYRHAYHAGNFADVAKHATLALVMAHMTAKATALRVIDTHAGRGRYDLDGPEAGKTAEWRQGIGRLLAAPPPDPVVPLLAPYLDAVAALNPTPLSAATLDRYPGSPLIVRHHLRAGDRLIANELQPGENAALGVALAGDRRCKVMGLDGWTAVKALLPPKERRGIVLVDPPFEEPGELGRLVTALQDAIRRFATGVVVLWYPIKDPRPVTAFRHEIAECGVPKLLSVELTVRTPDGYGLAGCGLILANPPFGLDAELATLIPFLAERLAVADGAGGAVRWLVGERV